jgi:hypothetical protein
MLAAKFGSLHSEEMRAREVFEEKLAKHFLSTMFRGMGDYPPPFATEKPPAFDDKLPKISLQVKGTTLLFSAHSLSHLFTLT